MHEELQRRLGRHLTLIGWGGGVVGAVVIFFAVSVFYPAFGGSVRENITSGWVNAPVIVAVLVCVGLIQSRVTRRHAEKALAWLEEGRPPDEHEHRLTLGL